MGKTWPRAAERFDSRVVKTDSCWLWQGALTTRGYAQFRVDEELVFVHRYSYQRFIGEIPEGLTIDHLCGIKTCVNPAHLEAVSRGENARRAARPREWCRRGLHRLAETGRPNGANARTCGACRAARDKRYA